MGVRRRAALRRWGRGLVAAHAEQVARVMGVAAPLPRVRVHVSRRAEHPAWCVGSHIVLGERWFAAHPDDAGAVVHELSHAVLALRTHPQGTGWLLEGIADLVRNRVGTDAEPPAPPTGPGGATAGYQPTAHFLEWVEARSPGTVAHLVRQVRLDRYSDDCFTVDGQALTDLVRAYDAGLGG